MLVKAGGPGSNPQVAQQTTGYASVFGGHQSDFRQDPRRPGRQVFQVADGRSYYI
jgi:hypothetical protein